MTVLDLLPNIRYEHYYLYRFQFVVVVGFATMGTASAKTAAPHRGFDHEPLSPLTVICVTQFANKITTIPRTLFYQSMTQLGVRTFLCWHAADYVIACTDIGFIADLYVSVVQ